MIWFLRMVLFINGLIMAILGGSIFMASALQQTYMIVVPLPEPEVYGHLMGISWLAIAWLLLHSAVTKHSAMVVGRKFGFMAILSSLFIGYFAYNNHHTLSQLGVYMVGGGALTIFILGLLEVWLVGAIKSSMVRKAYADKVLKKHGHNKEEETVDITPSAANALPNNTVDAVVTEEVAAETADGKEVVEAYAVTPLGDGTADSSALDDKKKGWRSMF